MASEGDLSLTSLIPQAITELVRRESTGCTPVTGGVGCVSTELRFSHEQNRLLLDQPVPWAVATADAERVLGGAGLAHRRIDWLRGGPDDVPADPSGWQLSRTVSMTAPRQVRGSAGGAREVTYEQVRPALWADWREYLPDADPAVIDHLADRRQVTARVCDLSWHAVLVDDEVVAFCDLRLLSLAGRTLAQVEDVTTASDHRGHGYGGNVVVHAVRAARAAGADLVWLDADADDWPREWYSRIGFVETGGGSLVATATATATGEREVAT